MRDDSVTAYGPQDEDELREASEEVTVDEMREWDERPRKLVAVRVIEKKGGRVARSALLRKAVLS
jgi:hypothetical protein